MNKIITALGSSEASDTDYIPVVIRKNPKLELSYMLSDLLIYF